MADVKVQHRNDPKARIDNDIIQYTDGRYSTLYTNPDDGERYFVDAVTGEAVPSALVEVPVGSTLKVKTPGTIRDQKQYLAKKDEWRKLPLGHFIFAKRQAPLSDLSPQTVARLVYLATFTEPGKRTMSVSRQPVTVTRLPGILNLSVSVCDAFRKEVSDLLENKDGRLQWTTDDFINGKIQHGMSYERVYMIKVRELYEKTPARQHCYLGYLFQMMPYVNTKYNILCTNVQENNYKLIKPLRFGDFCKMIGYDENQISRLFNTYRKIQLDVYGQLQYVFGWVLDPEDPHNTAKYRVFVNPRIMYCGSDLSHVEGLCSFCVPD